MTARKPPFLLVGEVFVDVTVTPSGQENKLRLGGIVHAARGFWALGIPFAAAVIVPGFLGQTAKKYLERFGCVAYSVLGHIIGAPNVILIFDPTEVDDQQYEDLLRDEKSVELLATWDSATLAGYKDALVFPGTYDLAEVSRRLPESLRLHIDVAYDVEDLSELGTLRQPIGSIFISTSSPLFIKTGMSGIDVLSKNFSQLKPDALVLKENRGGCRLHTYSTGLTEEIPAQLGVTVNSVGVGDVFDATYVACLEMGSSEAAWRAALASSAYAQTTEPDIFEAYVQRDARLSLAQMKDLGGTFLRWELRKQLHIYLAAPDFARCDRRAIERAASALAYHNFNVRRPVVENGELPLNSDDITLSATYRKDVKLLKECQLLFAVPTGRDPGTLVEIGLAIADNIPVVVYDPDGECTNTMVVGGSRCYSRDLDTCLNATFDCLSRLVAGQ
jgi:nucleoside 2-deoxyribosyltransferase